MEGMCSGKFRNETEKMRNDLIECEICDRIVEVQGNHAGFYICSACHRDIAAPHHIHD